MITQYDAVAEIEALKWRLTRLSREPHAPGTTADAAPPRWQRATEDDIRREMERRLARRAATKRA